jgi:tetratricopeptide (TPR) repeat protein
MRFPLVTAFNRAALTAASHRLVSPLLIALLLSGCSVMSQFDRSNAAPATTDNASINSIGNNTGTDHQATAPNKETKPKPEADVIAALIDSQEAPPTRPFSEQTLYNLLIAELATHEQNFPLAIEKYLLEAQNTLDSGLASHATRLSLYGRDIQAALSSAQLWLQIEPDSEKAAAIYADLLTQSGEALHALDVLEAQYSFNRTPNYGVLSQTTLAAGDRQLTELLTRLAPLVEQHPDHTELIFTYALLLQQNEQHSEALATLDTVKDIQANPSQAALLRAQLLENVYDAKTAAKSLSKAIKKQPNERSLRLYRAKLLTRFDLEGAEKAFAYLLEDAPNDINLLFSHAVVANENKHYEVARRGFEKLISHNQRITVSHYYLGQIAEQQGEANAAIARYRQVKAGKYFMPATQRLINLQARQGQLLEARRYLASLRLAIPLQAPNFWALEAALLKSNDLTEDAKKILDLAIERFPEQLLLRLERALMSEQLNDFATAESDLRFILSRDPDNVTALNALGYSLSNQTGRYEEALVFVEKAFALRPNDPAIIDSLGWAQYRLGQFETAINYLEIAFEQFPDDEVAAHLIEAYWVSGEKSKARNLIKQFKKQLDDTPQVDETINRLSIPW